MLNKFLQSVLHPERYHGNVFRPPFFEGWYFKLVTEDQQNAFAVIPGVSLTRKKEQSHAFVQVLEGNSGAVHVFRYPLSAFRSDSKSFNISIGENHFSLDGVSLSLEDYGF